MIVGCPQCGWPQEEGISGIEVKCSFCGWKGRAEDRLIFSGELESYPQIALTLQRLFIFIAKEMTPMLGKELVRSGLVGKDKMNVPLLATILREVARATFATVLKELFPTENKDVQ